MEKQANLVDEIHHIGVITSSIADAAFDLLVNHEHTDPDDAARFLNSGPLQGLITQINENLERIVNYSEQIGHDDYARKHPNPTVI